MARRRVQMGKWIALTTVLVGLPFVGAAAAGREVAPYLEFPPHEIGQAPEIDAAFSWIAFAAYAAFIAGIHLPIAVRAILAGTREPATAARDRFPWWGWSGVVLGVVAWTLAWNRFSFFAHWQKETFVLLWLAYMLVFNGLAQRRRGAAPISAAPMRYAALFAASAAFWWSFEYLNRFARNWRYVEIEEFGPGQYAIAATLAFATVLPAFHATYEWLAGTDWVTRGFTHWFPLRFPRPRPAAAAGLLLSAAGLAGLGVRPDLFFPLVWVSPVLVVVSIQTLRGRPHVLSGIARGDWRRPVASAAAALVCGFFWEMWNAKSQARWEYDIPYVGRFHLFEMPLLGYAGYVPFGLMCSTVAEAVMHPRAAERAPAAVPGGQLVGLASES